MAGLFEGEAIRLRSALLTTLKDYHQVADLFAEDGIADYEIRLFYLALSVHCLSLQDLLARKTDLHPIRSFLHQALNLLESFVVAPLVSPDSQDDQNRIFPGLELLHDRLISHDDPRSKLAALRECVAFENKKKRLDLLELLHSGCTAAQSRTHIDASESELAPLRKTRPKPPDDVRSAANSLFRVLKAKRGCNCEPIHTYIVQLSLGTHRTRSECCDFDLYFGLKQTWQEARVQTSAPSVSMTYHTAINSSGGSGRSRSRPHRVDKLCEAIMSIKRKFSNPLALDLRLEFRLEEDCLWRLQPVKSNLMIDESKAPVSLTQLLTEGSTLLNDRIKRILSVLLGYAVFHLHETPWLSPTWGSCNVMFFRSSEGLPMRPYLRNQLSDDFVTEQLDLRSRNSEDEDYDLDDMLLPPYPCLIGLAIALMELHKAASFGSLLEFYGIQVVDEPDLATRFLITRELFDRCKREFTDQTRMAISACLDPNIGLNDFGNDLDDIGLQSIIYERIVHRLEDELEQGFQDVAIEKLDQEIQGLDLANGGRQIHDIRRLGSGGMSTNFFRKLDIAGRVQPQSSSTDVITETIDELLLPPTKGHNMNRRKPSKEKIGGVIKVEESNDTSSESEDNFIAPTVPRKMSGDRPDTLRVMNIPDGMSELDLSTRLEHHFAWKCKIHSLVRASRDTRWKKHATVTFPGLDNITLSDTMRKLQILQHQIVEDHLEFDTGFLGLTSLYDEGASAIVEQASVSGPFLLRGQSLANNQEVS